MSIFNKRLKEIRTLKKCTQKSLAEYLNITERSYQNYEYGTREPNFDTAIKLADYFNVSIDYLVGRTDNKEVNK